MSSRLDLRAQEGSSYGIRVDFNLVDSNGNSTPIVPNVGLNWSLSDIKGNIINERENIELTPAESVTIVLHGADLALSGNYPEKRRLTIYGTYDSGFGTGLALVSEVEFHIENLVGV